MFLERSDESFHGLDWIQIDHGAAQLADGFDLMLGEKLLLFSGAALGNINGREQAAIGKFPIKHEFHVTGALEFLENEFVHARTRIYEGGGQNSEGATFFNFPG